jgi:hypothetical protein
MLELIALFDQVLMKLSVSRDSRFPLLLQEVYFI